MIDIVATDISEWQVKTDEYTLNCEGMRREGGPDHGITRAISSEGSIHERSVKDGKFHGLHRAVFHDKVRLSLYKEGERLAFLAFDHDFEEFYRHDPDNYLSNVSAGDFKNESDDPES